VGGSPGSGAAPRPVRRPFQRIGAATGTALTAVILQAGGFTPALTWMLVFTAVAFVTTVFLPGRAKPRPVSINRQPTCPDEQSQARTIHS
jgi:hypothetical protein